MPRRGRLDGHIECRADAGGGISEPAAPDSAMPSAAASNSDAAEARPVRYAVGFGERNGAAAAGHAHHTTELLIIFLSKKVYFQKPGRG